MLFNSFDFAIFFAIVFGAYVLLRKSHRGQNWLLVGASLAFYAWWDWRFVSLLLCSSIGTYVLGERIARTERSARRAWLIFGIISSVAILASFKYLGFFVENVAELLRLIGFTPHISTLNIILPLGISFYTFEAISYMVDIYRKKAQPAKRLGDFLLFMSFFPHLIAGPIMRIGTFLPQVEQRRAVTGAGLYSGAALFVWGLYKKVVVADNLALLVDPVFAGGTHTGAQYLLGIVAFGFQIYADFSGYTDMARGMARWFGFELSRNFLYPYFAENPSDFWRRWHITLSSWFRDYVYIPLGGNRAGLVRTCVNLLVTMLLAGLWHGAKWTFVLWGGYQGLLLVIHRLWTAWIGTARPGGVRKVIRIGVMLPATMFGWLFFRAQNTEQIGEAVRAIAFNFSPASVPVISVVLLCFFASGLILIELMHYRGLFTYRAPAVWHVVGYGAIAYSILLLGVLGGTQFIYFQF